MNWVSLVIKSDGVACIQMLQIVCNRKAWHIMRGWFLVGVGVILVFVVVVVAVALNNANIDVGKS